MISIRRIFRHLFFPRRRLKRAFPVATLNAIERAIKLSESTHLGEIRFAVEEALTLGSLWYEQSARERALDVFSLQHVWDTEKNNGVLIYILLAERDVEIVADRGINRYVTEDEWTAICQKMEVSFRRGEFEAGSLRGIERVSTLLAQHFPAEGPNVNELPDLPLVR